jgi:hypothetical protein
MRLGVLRSRCLVLKLKAGLTWRFRPRSSRRLFFYFILIGVKTMITQELADYACARAGERKISDIRIGVGYTGVLLDDGSCGVSYTFRNDLGPRCGVIENAGTLTGMRAGDAAEWSMDINLAKASVGIATINAILRNTLKGYSAVNAIDEMRISKGDTVGMVGYFHPVVSRFSGIARFYVFDRNLTAPEIYPDWSENILLPQCDVVIITGTTLINKTIDHVLSLCKKAREIVLMGSSVCMVPEVFRQHGITVLAGSKITDAQKTLAIISQGGGGLEVMDTTEKLCIRLN